MQQDKFDTGRIKKIVGKAVVEHPLERAFKLHLMLEELRGKRRQSTENVKKEVNKNNLNKYKDGKGKEKQ